MFALAGISVSNNTLLAVALAVFIVCGIVWLFRAFR